MNPCLAFYQMGMWEMMILLVVVLLLFGAKRIPEVAKSLGSGIREFKKSVIDNSDDDETTEKPKIDEDKDSV